MPPSPWSHTRSDSVADDIDFEAILDRIRADCPKIRELVCIDRTGSSAPAMQDWWAEAPATDPDVALKPGDLVGILSSGGTTGRPKASVLTHGQMAFVVTNHLADLMPGLTPADASLVVAPLSHGAGVHQLTQVARGVKTVLMPSERFDVDTVCALIAEWRVSTIFTVPTILKLIVEHPAAATPQVDDLGLLPEIAVDHRVREIGVGR